MVLGVADAKVAMAAFGGWVMVKADSNDPDALVEALKSGAYYSSQGPQISLSRPRPMVPMAMIG